MWWRSRGPSPPAWTMWPGPRRGEGSGGGAWIRVACGAGARGGSGVRVGRLGPRRLGAEAEVIRSLYNAAWGENWGALPMTSGEATSLASRLRAVLAPDLA